MIKLFREFVRRLLSVQLQRFRLPSLYMRETGIPQKVFMYWETGWDTAPRIAQICAESWHIHNPEFKIHLLDRRAVDSRVDLARYLPAEVLNGLSVQKRANLIRLALILEEGGFWADATLYCGAPLREWVTTTPPARLIALRTNQGQNRFVRNYFLGCSPGNYFVKAWLLSYSKFLNSSAKPMSKQAQKRWEKKFRWLVGTKLGTVFWTLGIVSRRIGYPYLIAHYIANRLILTNVRAAFEYLQMPDIRSGEALRYAKRSSGFEDLRVAFETGSAPVWKLSWRESVKPDYWNNVFLFFKGKNELINRNSSS